MFDLVTWLVLVSVCIEPRAAAKITFANANQQFAFNLSSFSAVIFDMNQYRAFFISNTTVNDYETNVYDFDTVSSIKYSTWLASPFLFGGILNSGNAVSFCSSEIVTLSKNDGYNLFNLSSPTSFLRSVVLNPSKYKIGEFNQTVLFAYNGNQVAELDVRMPLQSKVNTVNTGRINGGYTLTSMVYSSFGNKIALLVNENNVDNIHIFSQNTKQYLAKISSNVDGSSHLVYNVEGNLLVTVRQQSKTLNIFGADSYNSNGLINFSLTPLDPAKIFKVFSPIGTMIVLITTADSAYFFDLASKSFIEGVQFDPNAEGIYWVEGTAYFMGQFTVNVTNPNNTQTTQKIFHSYKISSSDSRLCHKSCGDSCAEVFKPCYNLWKIVWAMTIGITITLVFVSGVYFLFYLLFARSAKVENIEDDEGNVYELTAGGDFKQVRNTISLTPDEVQTNI